MIAPRHTQPPIPPDHGGEPPVTREFNRWLYGLVLPGAVFLWSLFILAGGRFRIPLRIRWREFVGSICSRFPAAADGRARPPGPLLVRTLRVAAALLETAGPAAAPALPHPARLPALAPDFADRFRPLRRKSVKIPVFPLRNRPGKRLYRQISEIGGKKFRGNMYCRLKTGKTTIYLSQRQTDKKGNR